MDEAFNRKYKRVLEILPDVAQCAQGKLVLVGGTALALFFLKHRISVDLDFAVQGGNEVMLKEGLKGCLSKRGYRASAGAFKNQFVVQFEDTSIKIEVFAPEQKIGKVEEHVFGASRLKVASLKDILSMKISAYGDRKEARDLFDIYCIDKPSAERVKKIVLKSGRPKNIEDIEKMAESPTLAAEFRRVVLDASS